jgi:hypothetical protein
MNFCFEEASKIKSVPILSVDKEMPFQTANRYKDFACFFETTY